MTPGMSGRRDFLYQIRHLSGSMLSREMTGSEATLSLFNPSIRDFLIHRFRHDTASALRAFSALGTWDSLNAFKEWERLGVFTKDETTRTCREIYDSATKADFLDRGREYFAEILRMSGGPLDLGRLKKFASNVDSLGPSYAHGLTTQYLSLAYEKRVIHDSSVQRYLRRAVEQSPSPDELKHLAKLASTVEKNGLKIPQEFSKIRDLIIDAAIDCIDDEVDDEDLFRDISYGDVDEARENLKIGVEQILDEFGIDFDSFEVDAVVDGYDLDARMRRYFEPSGRHETERSARPYRAVMAIDEIDDLFDRG